MFIDVLCVVWFDVFTWCVHWFSLWTSSVPTKFPYIDAVLFACLGILCILTPFNFDIGLLAVCLLKSKWFQKNYSLTNLLCWGTVFGKRNRNILLCSKTQRSKLIWNCSVCKTYVSWKNYWWLMWGNQSILVFFIAVFYRREKFRSVICLLKRIAFSKLV